MGTVRQGWVLWRIWGADAMTKPRAKRKADRPVKRCTFTYAVVGFGRMLIQKQDVRRGRNVVTGSYTYPMISEDRFIQRAVARQAGCAVIFRFKHGAIPL